MSAGQQGAGGVREAEGDRTTARDLGHTLARDRDRQNPMRGEAVAERRLDRGIELDVGERLHRIFTAGLDRSANIDGGATLDPSPHAEFLFGRELRQQVETNCDQLPGRTEQSGKVATVDRTSFGLDAAETRNLSGGSG